MRRFLLFPLFFVLFVTSVFAATGDNIPAPVTDQATAFVSGSIIVRGEGAAGADTGYSPSQKRLMAMRAAKVDALREATGIINGVMVSGETTVVNASARSGKVSASVAGIVRGAEVVKEVYDPISGEASVYLSVPMTGEGGLVGQLMEHIAPMYKRGYPAFQPLQGAMAGTYDGLIVDVRATPFKPALINRLVTGAGEIVYDPASVTLEVLARRGAAGYTNDIGKARAILSERGSKNPLVISAASVINSTDVVITPEEAGAVVLSDRSANFLENALVVFVLQ